MSHTNKRGWYRVVLAERIGERDGKGGMITEAEFYLAAGKMVRRRLRLGSRPETIGRTLGLPVEEVFCALRYADSSPSLVLRALVEDWSWQQIKAGLDKPLNAGDPVQRKG